SSIKAAKVWRASLAWEVPVYKGTGDLTYKIQRSTDNNIWTYVDETTGNSFLDTVPSSIKYYWKVGTTDSTDESKASPTYSNIVSILPKGSFTEAPLLTSDPSVSGITTKRATIKWTTDRKSDSKITYGFKTGEYFKGETSFSEQVTSHSVELDGLVPSTEYFYKAKWTDEDGNTGQSSELSFTTDSAPTIKNVGTRYINVSSAEISFTSTKANEVRLYYGKSTSFGDMKKLSTSTKETTYPMNLTNLLDGTKYFYRINPVDSEGIEYEGTILDFTTLPKPIVSDVKIQQIKNTVDTTMVISWKSNTEVSSIVSYYLEDNSKSIKDKIDLTLISGEHKLTLNSLNSDKSYILQVRGFDRLGNEAKSETIKFTTATDTRAPSITDVVIENVPNTINTINQSKSQVVISWNTDEPSSSAVEYGEGYSEIYPMKSITDFNLTMNHMVVLSELEPSKVYHFRVVSKDKANNEGVSSNMVNITLKQGSDSTGYILNGLRNLFNF
ncbi:MAG: fibronectin type III domain-containing protein, partial [bacterium]